MRSSVTHRFETDPHKTGNIIRSAGLERSGSPRGDVHNGSRILSDWRVDLSSCRTHISETEVMQLLLEIEMEADVRLDLVELMKGDISVERLRAALSQF